MNIKEVKPEISNFLVINGAEAWKEVVYSARMSGVPESVKDEDVFKMMIQNDYGSALEHIICKFDIKISKGNAPELLEHRMSSHSGYSTRYITFDNYEIIVPFHILKEQNDIVKKYFMRGVEEGFESYDTLMSINHYDKTLKKSIKDCPREVARYVLPFCSAVGIYHYTMNLRSLINFLQLRLCVRASAEMRCIASQLYFLLEKELPIIENMVGCRGFMRGVCPEFGVTGYRSGENKKCPFSNNKVRSFIPTQAEIGTAECATNGVAVNNVQKNLFKQWSEWK